MLARSKFVKAQIYQNLFMMAALSSTVMIGSVAMAQNLNPYLKSFPNNSQHNTFPIHPQTNPQQQYYCSTLGRYCSVLEFNQEQVQSQIKRTLPSSTQPFLPTFSPRQQYYCSNLGRHCAEWEFSNEQSGFRNRR